MSCSLLTLLLLSVPAPPEPQGDPLLRRHHQLRVVGPSQIFEARRFELEGLLTRDQDGAWRIDRKVSRETRQRVSEARKVPLRTVPAVISRRMEVGPGGPSDKELQAKEGLRVRIRFTRDRSGQSFAVALLNPHRP